VGAELAVEEELLIEAAKVVLGEADADGGVAGEREDRGRGDPRVLVGDGGDEDDARARITGRGFEGDGDGLEQLAREQRLL
jgi:hypothetical protein